MKKITSFLGIMLIALCMMFSACTGCNSNNNGNNTPEPEVVTAGYNYDSVVRADYDYIASQHKFFRFYEVDVIYKDLLTQEGEPEIISIKTVFQCGDTCIQFLHNEGMEDTLYIADYYLECQDMSAYNAVTYDSCMSIIAPYRHELKTRALTFRRILAPPFPENGQYIFGTGILVVDSNDGHIERWDEAGENEEAELQDPDTVVLE